jgi:hypothetical protein
MSNEGTRWIAEYAAADAVVFRHCERPHVRLAYRRRATSMSSGGYACKDPYRISST